MDKNTRVLISGAGVAGLTCAIWLGRQGFRPVVIEKSSSIRADGFIISLSHESYRYAESLDLLHKIKAKNAGIKQSSYHDRDGRAMLKLKYEDLFAGIDVVQIMRDDLEDILYDAAKDIAEIRLSTSLAMIEADGDGTQVRFDDGRNEEFDVVIGADGVHSNTRSLSFDATEYTKYYLGLFSSAYRLPNTINLHEVFQNHMERSRYMCVYTTRDNDLGCVFIWKSDKLVAPPPAARYRELKTQFEDAPALVTQVVAGFCSDQPMYMDPLVQIEMRRWSKGNVVLLGDAAHCLTLLSGQGASSAFWGACKLAQSLVDCTKSDAFKAYENTFRPMITEIQSATRLAAKWYVPGSVVRYVLRDAAMRYLPDQLFQHYFKSKYSKA